MRVGLGLGSGVLLALIGSGCATQYPEGAGGSGRDVVLITIDTLRADHLSSYGYERPTSPNVDELAASEPVLTAAELDHWHEHGYVVLRRAVEPAACAAAVSSSMSVAASTQWRRSPMLR